LARSKRLSNAIKRKGENESSVVHPDSDSFEQKFYAACDHGVLVKKGDLVRVSTSFAVLGNDLESLKETIATSFKEMEQERKELNISIGKLELGLTKGLINLNQGSAHAKLQ